MKRLVIKGISIVCVFFLATGCASVTCDKIDEECGAQSFFTDCEQTYKDGDSSCKSAMRSFADCVEDKGCDFSVCHDERSRMLDKCDTSDPG